MAWKHYRRERGGGIYHSLYHPPHSSATILYHPAPSSTILYHSPSPSIFLHYHASKFNPVSSSIFVHHPWTPQYCPLFFSILQCLSSSSITHCHPGPHSTIINHFSMFCLSVAIPNILHPHPPSSTIINHPAPSSTTINPSPPC
jgi:hypothetical protein